MLHRILLAAAFVYLTAANLIWIARDTRPPFWDMAVHQSSALQIHDAIRDSGPAGIIQVLTATRPYPPLYHAIVAAFYGGFGRSIDAAQFANIPAVLLLLLATYGIGRKVLTPLGGAVAAVLTVFFPYLLWLSRETVVDYWLTAMVAAAIWILLSTPGISDSRWAVAFGIIAGMGMLTKWTFLFFVVLPFLWFAGNNLKNAALAAAVAIAISAIWYTPAALSLVGLFDVNSGQALVEGDPGRLSWQAFIFYVRALEGYQLFLPLFTLFVAGLILMLKDFERRWAPIALWVVGGWIGLLLFQNKDPRYSAPLLPAIALISAIAVERKRIFLYLMIPLLLIQHFVVSFGIPYLPDAVVLARGADGPIPWNWNLYTQRYFDLWGPPKNEDWRIEYVLRKVSRDDRRPVRVAMIPDIPRFDSQAFQLYARIENAPVVVYRLLNPEDGAISDSDYILLSETDPGPAYAALPAASVNDYILSRPERFEMLEQFSIPNGDVIRLYKVARS